MAPRLSLEGLLIGWIELFFQFFFTNFNLPTQVFYIVYKWVDQRMQKYFIFDCGLTQIKEEMECNTELMIQFYKFIL